MTTTGVQEHCPQCRAALVHRPNQPSWCPECEWNLVAREYAEHRRPSRSARRARLRAFELNRRGYAELRGSRPAGRSSTRSRRIIAAASAALLLVDVALLAGGAFLLSRGSVGLGVVGLLLVLIGIECRPRLPRMRHQDGLITRDQAPALFAMIDQARTSIGAPPIDILIVNDGFNASCARVGLRRRTVLSIGLTIWVALTPAARLALLGHELGHLVNQDPTRAFTSQPALTTFNRLADVFDPRGMADARIGYFNWLMWPVTYVVFLPLHLFFRRLHLALLRVSARDRQRAEIYADALGAELGGTAGAEELMRVLLFQDSVRTALQRAATNGCADPVLWRSVAAAALDARRPDTRVAEQESLRMEVSGYATHPPAGMRLRLVTSWPSVGHRLDVPDATFAESDAELAQRYAGVRRDLVNSWAS